MSQKQIPTQNCRKKVGKIIELSMEKNYVHNTFVFLDSPSKEN